MTIALKINRGNTRYTLDLAPVGSEPGWNNILFYKINNGNWMTLCHNDPCKTELTLDFVEEKGNKCPKCKKLSKTQYHKDTFFKKLITNMMGNPSHYTVERITKLCKEGRETITC